MLTIALFALALTADGEAVEAVDPFAPMAPLIGRCWDGASEKRKMPHDIHCYQRTSPTTVVSEHVVYTDPLYCGKTIWTLKDDKVSYFYTNNLGGRSQGTVEDSEDGVDFPHEVYVSADGQELTFETKFRFLPNGDFIKRTYDITGGKRKRVSQTLFVPIPDDPKIGPAGYTTCQK